MLKTSFRPIRKPRLAFYAFLTSAALAVPQALHPANIAIPFSPSNFSNPLNISNVLFPLVAGKTLIYHAATPDGCEEDRMAITSQTKTIAGVTARGRS